MHGTAVVLYTRKSAGVRMFPRIYAYIYSCGPIHLHTHASAPIRSFPREYERIGGYVRANMTCVGLRIGSDECGVFA